MNLEHSYASLPQGFFHAVTPNKVSAPELLAWNSELASELGLDGLGSDEQVLADYFSGNTALPQSQPIATAYAGHQFGHFVPQLGDGRAVLLGETTAKDGERYDIQLKGSGRTPFSRGGDGKSWLGPVIREYILSEAMHHLGIPTTRALAAVATGEKVYREFVAPGAVFTRVASSHIRVGTFQFFAAREQSEDLRTLADYAIQRHYPEALDMENPYLEFFTSVTVAQAKLIARWMSIGFIHGVMNTDNTAISGETIDYGPAAYMDEFRYEKVFSSIDQMGRYAYGNQPAIGQWNLARLADTLLMLGVEKESLESVLNDYPERYYTEYYGLMMKKLGIREEREGDRQLVTDLLTHFEENELDYTLSFRQLSKRIDREDTEFGEVETRWRKRIAEQDVALPEIATGMNRVNPLFIPRNHRVEKAIQKAVEGDLSAFNDMNQLLENPFTEQPEYAHYAEPPAPEDRVTQTFCGT